VYPRFFDISSHKYPYVVDLTWYPFATLNLQPQQRNSNTLKKRRSRKSSITFRHRSRRGSSTRTPPTSDVPAVPPLLGANKIASSIPAVPTLARHEASPPRATSSTQRVPVAPFAELTRTTQSPPKPSARPPPQATTAINLRPYDPTAPQTFFVPPHRPSDLYVEVGPSRRIVL